MADLLEPGSPRWWLRRLHGQLVERQRLNDVYRRYYCGVHPVPWLTAEAQEEFRRLLDLTRSNYMGLVIDAQVERQEVVGFRVNTPGARSSGDQKADEDMSRIWEANGLDAYFPLALLDAATTGTSYLLVEPPRAGGDLARIYIEDADQFIIEHVPGTNRRDAAAALKLWLDDWTGRTMATLHLPGYVFKAQSTDGGDLASMLWAGRGTDLVFAESTGLDYIPAWEIANNPLLGTGGRSEIDDVIVNQDRINKGLADRLITQDFGAFPQKWASGWPDEDAAGNPTQKIDVGQNRIMTTSAIDTKFGQFAAADLNGYIDTKQADVKDIASRTRTPAQYLLGEVANVAGDTLRMAESGLVAKVRSRCRMVSVNVEVAMQSARDFSGLPVLPRGVVVEAIWRNPEFRTEGELVDALTKMSTLGVPREVLWEKWGATPGEIRRWRAMAEEEQRALAALDPLATLAGRYTDTQQQPVDNSLPA